MHVVRTLVCMPSVAFDARYYSHHHLLAAGTPKGVDNPADCPSDNTDYSSQKQKLYITAPATTHLSTLPASTNFL